MEEGLLEIIAVLEWSGEFWESHEFADVERDLDLGGDLLLIQFVGNLLLNTSRSRVPMQLFTRGSTGTTIWC